MAKLVLSPSQQPTNQYAGGGTGTADSEQKWMTDLAAKIKARWDAQGTGIPCVIVAKGSYQANVAASNALQATEHLALHTNAGGSHGSEIWHYQNLLGVPSAGGKHLATDLYPFISAASNAPDRGIKGSSKYGELNQTKARAVIIEYAYHDNPAEAQEIRTSLDEFAEATVKGLCRYYGKTYKPVPPPTAAWRLSSQDADTIVLRGGPYTNWKLASQKTGVLVLRR